MTKYTDRWFEVQQDYDMHKHTKDSGDVYIRANAVSEKKNIVTTGKKGVVIDDQDMNDIIELCVSAK